MEAKAKEIGYRKQLFVDDYIIEGMKGVSTTLNPAKKHPANPLVVSDRPWEGSIQLYGTVLYDKTQKLFRMWYYGGPTGSLYATSKDGLKWEKPNLGLYEYEGSKENNAIPDGPCFVVYNPEMYGYESDERRYKTFHRDKSGWGAIFSKDGLHWTPHSGNPLLTGVSDECPISATSHGVFPERVLYKDAIPPKYIAFPKIGVWVGKFPRRSVAFSHSNDFIKWTKPVLVLAPDERDDEISETRIREALEDGLIDIDHPDDHRAEFYHLCVFPYESLYLGFLDVFYANAELKRIGQLNQTGPDEVQLVSSRDLIHWERAGDRQPIIPNGKRGDWDRGWKSTVNIPIVVGDEIWIYYCGVGGHNILVWTEKTAPPLYEVASYLVQGIGLAILRLDGFVSVDAGQNEGILTTKPLVFEGNKLVINAQTQNGSVTVEILDEKGRPVKGFRRDDCDAFTGDSVRHTVTWKGSPDVASLQGKTVKLRFRMKNAKLYSFVFAN